MAMRSFQHWNWKIEMQFKGRSRKEKRYDVKKQAQVPSFTCLFC